MKSTIRVEYDFDQKTPYLQLRLDGHDEENGDLKDRTLQHFIEEANHGRLYLTYNSGGGYVPQIRVEKQDPPKIVSVEDELNWIPMNATCVISDHPDYKEKEKYNLLFATSSYDNGVYIKGAGLVGEPKATMKYTFLCNFLDCWKVSGTSLNP